MNLVLALILAIIILLCMFLIPNKLFAVAVVLIVVIMLILARPGDFTLKPSYIITNNNEEDEEEGSVQEEEQEEPEEQEPEVSEEPEVPEVPEEPEVPEANLSGMSQTVMESIGVSAANEMNSPYPNLDNLTDMIGLSNANKDAIQGHLEDIDWGNILKKSISKLKSYGEEKTVEGTNTSVLCNNSTALNFGSAANCMYRIESGSPNGAEESGSPNEAEESGSPDVGAGS